MARSNIIPLFEHLSRPARVHGPTLPDVRESIFRAMDLGTGDGILFADGRMEILRVGEQAAELHNTSAADIVGKDVRSLFMESGHTSVTQAIQSLSGNESWAGEMDARRMPDEVFPADVTIKRIPLDGQPIFCFVIRDLSEARRLRELLRQQRSQRHEMYVTIRNLMKAFEKEKQGLEKGIYHKIK